MSARALCNEVHGMLVTLHGAEAVDELLHPPSVEVVERSRERRARSLAILRGEV